MFEQVLVVEARGSKRFWTTCAGVTGQVALVASLMLAPLVWPDSLPHPEALIKLLLPPVPPGPVQRVATLVRTSRVPVGHKFVVPDGKTYQPATTPTTIDTTPDDPPPQIGNSVVGSPNSGPAGAWKEGVWGSIWSAATPLAPPKPIVKPTPAAAATEPAPIKRYTAGGLVKMATIVRRVEPVYPPLARQARISGAVQLQGIIGVDGRIHELKVISGHPLLIAAAVAAVQQWIYTPTTLNGELVEVIAPITVNFILN
jgi:protein TonB